MERYTWKWLGLVLFVVFMVTTVNGPSAAWAWKNSLAKQIQGTWTLVSIVNEREGEKREPFGANPIGSLIITANGRFMMTIMRADIPNYTGTVVMHGTPEEYKSVAEGAFAIFGWYKVVNEKDGKTILHAEGCSYPNWKGKDLERFYTVKGEELKMIAVLGVGNGTNNLTWKRIK